MNVRNLIEKLSALPFDAEVHVEVQDYDDDGGVYTGVSCPVVDVFQWEPSEPDSPVEIAIDEKNRGGDAGLEVIRLPKV